MAAAKPTFEALFDSFLADEFFGPASKTLTITISSGGTVDPNTGAVTGGSSSVYSANGFMRSIREKEFRDVRGGDLVFTIKQSDLGYTPLEEDQAVISGGSTWDGTYSVVEVMADGADVTYKVQLRR